MIESGENEILAQRRANLDALTAGGQSAFGSAFPRSGALAEVKAAFEENKTVAVAGRLVGVRDMGKSTFAHLQDFGGRLQIYVQKNGIGDDAYAAFKHLDLGDFIGVEGALFTTRTGEPTVKITRWTLLAKALRPLPEKWHGLKDSDACYRQRYLDLIANEETRRVFDLRIRVVRELREFLQSRGFLEVETPMMQPQAGGAAARPFVTHHTALNADMYLRIAPELYLKRLLVGGFNRIFEMNRNFRNEGLSRTHNPEFTMMEVYEAYSDRGGMQKLVEELITTVAERALGTLKAGSAEAPIDLARPWREASYRDLVRERAGADWFERDRAGMAVQAQALGLNVDPAWGTVEITQEVYEKLIERTLQNPTFVTRLPAELVPLAKRCPDDTSVVDVFELVIGGKEVAPGYSELNDPIEQRRRFEQQAGAEAQLVDEDFLLAMEHGMPPAGGMGIGIDRLVMTLAGCDAIRDVLLFPQLKPRE